MGTSRGKALLLIAAGSVIAACTSPAPPAPPAPAPPSAPIEAPPVESGAPDAALAAYDSFWAVSQRALAAPGTKDWTPELEAVASGQALDAIQSDVDNFADYPAHNEGSVTRDPVVDSATDTTAEITDCVDLSDYLLIADKTGEILTDTANQVPRFRYRAHVVKDESGRWLVNRTTPALDEPC
ncbi:hypothetical protein [Pseudonocardia lacus]|uniref:hypothetical protein n=1 Tax=Pseudonocardia lacus TaxID=2835865 RepID=UPI001BDBC186|nr:hypothetical protein [Pseudonocardia lacus]